MILAGDIGGTKVNLAGVDPGGSGLRMESFRTYASQKFGGLEEVVQTFLAETRIQISSACFGIAGPVVDGRCETTNLPWTVDSRELAASLATDRVWLLNDLEANGYGIPALSPSQLAVVHPGQARKGNGALIAAGTGLGEVTLFWNGTHHVPSASEGGHTDFAARTEEEIRLFRFLSARYGHVSYERILSGRGFVDLYDFELSEGGEPSAEVASARCGPGDPAPAISAAGLQGSCPVSARVLSRFLNIYGAEAGNLALKSLAVSGVYIGGGIGPRLAGRLTSGEFLSGFLDKGRFRPLLERIPVLLILEPLTALLGAAAYARSRTCGS